VSRGSLEEAHAKGDPGHMQWLWDIASHSAECLKGAGRTAASETLATCLARGRSSADTPRHTFLSHRDRRLRCTSCRNRCCPTDRACRASMTAAF
jgi:hypothetical protein